MDFSSQGPPFTSVVDTLSSGGKVPLKEGRDELDFWLVLATKGKKGKSSPPGLEALLEIYGSSVKRRPSWSLNSTFPPNTISTLLAGSYTALELYCSRTAF